jgi:hypothetical protein
MQSIDRWRSWTPGEGKNIGNDHKMELTKLTKPGSVGFVSSLSVQSSIILAASGMAIHDPAAWAEDFHRWVITECIFRDRCFGGVGGLLRHFCEWQVTRDEVPCTRNTFEALLRDSGFFFAEGLVYGLLLKADVLAVD